MPGAQRGAALLVLLAILVLLTAAILLDKLNAAVAPTPSRDPKSVEALGRAKEALIAWAATHPDTPGLLPFPDRNDDSTPNYDGTADCVSPGPVVAGHLLGRFPIQGEQAGCLTNIGMSVEVVDSAGERLWYAVSRNLVRVVGGGPINPDIGDSPAQWITVRDQNGAVINNRVAAVVIAPGPALAGQDRRVIDANPLIEYPKYLESVTIGPDTFSNADADGCLDDDIGCVVPGEDFIIYPNTVDAFNDRLMFITVEELMRAVEKRVVGDVAQMLLAYRNAHGLYPWLSPFRNPRVEAAARTSDISGQATNVGPDPVTLLDTAQDFSAPPVLVGDLVRNLTDGSSGIVMAVVSPTTLTVDALSGGSDNQFETGDDYVVPTPFTAVWGTREGHIPYIDIPNGETFDFDSGFTVSWTSGNASTSTTPDPSLCPVDASIILPDIQNTLDTSPPGGISVLPRGAGGTGRCTWTQATTVQCTGSWTEPAPYLPVVGGCGGPIGPADRTFTFELNYSGSDAGSSVGGIKTRDVVSTNPLPVLPGLLTVQIVDSVGGTVIATGSLTAVQSNTASFTTSGIFFDLEDPGELPPWFIANKWHYFVYVSLSSRMVAGPPKIDDNATAGSAGLSLEDTGRDFVVAGVAPGDLVRNVTDGSMGFVQSVSATVVVVDQLAGGSTNAFTAGDNYRIWHCDPSDCLIMDAETLTPPGPGLPTARDDIRAAVIGTGVTVSSQDRQTGTPCPGEPRFLCDYLENTNQSEGDDTFVRNNALSGFNDQIRIVAPSPP